jgi:hypothetical protein
MYGFRAVFVPTSFVLAAVPYNARVHVLSFSLHKPHLLGLIAILEDFKQKEELQMSDTVPLSRSDPLETEDSIVHCGCQLISCCSLLGQIVFVRFLPMTYV